MILQDAAANGVEVLLHWLFGASVHSLIFFNNWKYEQYFDKIFNELNKKLFVNGQAIYDESVYSITASMASIDAAFKVAP